jgi:hypothetical protein
MDHRVRFYARNTYCISGFLAEYSSSALQMIYHLRNQSNPIVGNRFIAPATVMCLWNWNCFLILESYPTTSIWNQLLRIRLKAPFPLSKKRERDHDRAALRYWLLQLIVQYQELPRSFKSHRRICLHHKSQYLYLHLS